MDFLDNGCLPLNVRFLWNVIFSYHSHMCRWIDSQADRTIYSTCHLSVMQGVYFVRPPVEMIMKSTTENTHKYSKQQHGWPVCKPPCKDHSWEMIDFKQIFNPVYQWEFYQGTRWRGLCARSVLLAPFVWHPLQQCIYLFLSYAYSSMLLYGCQVWAVLFFLSFQLLQVFELSVCLERVL